MTQALLLVGHGTRSTAGTEEFFALADRVRAAAPALPVGTGFIELSPPPISTAVADLVASGARSIVVVPLVLLGAGHAKTDVPASIALARHAHPGVSFTYAAALGIHPDVLTIVDERLDATVPQQERSRTAVVVVGRGSSDPDANADLAKVARLLWEGREYPLVEHAFVGITAPRVPEALERCRRLGAERAVVVPYFLFTGVLEDRIRAQSEAFAASTGMPVTVTRYLGPDDRIANLVLHRFNDALTGGARPNCDLCVHRIALPGFADKVGAPQTPHHHPHD